MSATYGKC